MEEDKNENLSNIIGLINLLSSEDEELVSVATANIIKKGESNVPILVNALNKSNSKLRYKVIEILENFQSESLLPSLTNLLQDKNVWVRWRAARLLCIMGDKVGYMQLITELDKGPIIGKVLAADTIGDLQLGEATDILLTALYQNKNTQVRKSIIIALGKLADVKALDFLFYLMQDRQSLIRWWVVDSIYLISSRTGDKRAIDLFITHIRDTNPDVRYRIALALGDFGDPKALNVLKHSYKYDKGRIRKGGKMKVRDAMIDAINKITTRTA